MKKILLVYDDHIRPNPFIRSIVGDKGFGNIILKRISVKQKFQDFLSEQRVDCNFIEISSAWEVEPFLAKIRVLNEDYRVLHIFSNYVVRNTDEASCLIQKIPYVNIPVLAIENKMPVLFMFKSLSEYIHFVENNFQNLLSLECFSGFDITETNAFFDISIHSNFLGYISGGFDARFFNSVQGDEFTVTKSSHDIKKIRAEYEFYRLLPDEMKIWFVMPYNYQEADGKASYQMERLHMTDLAIRYAHGAIDLQECTQLLDKSFYFINHRKSKEIPRKEQRLHEDMLYLQKIDERVRLLKQCKEYRNLSDILRTGTEVGSIDHIIERYKSLYNIIRSRREKEKSISVIGHGDLCFSNMLFNKETSLLKLIDPKGAVIEEQLWTDPYYDVAKLSHSICGRYDFFNNGLFSISINKNLQFDLEISFDNKEHISIFKAFCKNNGFDYTLVRLYEASLFLSMLPLHMDNPLKVLGFVLNAVDILNEVEENV